MSKHTKAPWSASWDCNGLGYVGVGPNCTVAHIVVPPSGDQEANARLIAAAPDLLEALQSLEPLLEAVTIGLGRVWVEADGSKTDFGAALDEARAAIAKATGEDA